MSGAAPPLSEEFLDWWFAPWRLPAALLVADPRVAPGAPDAVAQPQPGQAGQIVQVAEGGQLGQLAQRHGYRSWCLDAGVQVDFSAQFDSGWQFAALDSAAALRRAARLFAGLLAAREGDQQRLGQLAPVERRWCMSLALAQPVSGLMQPDACAFDTLETRGLLELACALEDGFPGMWTRLRLLLPLAQQVRIADGLRHGRAEGLQAAPRAARGQRCWRLCIERAPLLPLKGPCADTTADHAASPATPTAPASAVEAVEAVGAVTVEVPA